MNICLFGNFFFIIRNNISHEKREERSTFLYSHPEGSSIYRVLSGNVCLQHRIWVFVNGTTEKACTSHHFGICDHQGASSEGQENGSHLMPRPHRV